MQWTSALPIVGVVSRHHHHPSEGSTPRGPLIFNEALHSTSWHPLGADTWWRQTWEKWSKREEHLVPWFLLCCDSPSENKCDTLAPFPRGRNPKGAIDSFRAHSHGSSRSCWVVHAHRLGISWPRTLVSHVNLNVSHCVQILGESEKQSMIW